MALQKADELAMRAYACKEFVRLRRQGLAYSFVTWQRMVIWCVGGGG